MAKTTNVSVRMDAELKMEAETILASLGLTTSQAINIFYKQITFQNGLPFQVKIPEKKLNDVTRKAMEEKNLESFNSPQELFDELGI